MNCINLEEVKRVFNKYKLTVDNVNYWTPMFKIYNPDNITLQFIINECKKDKTIIYTKKYYRGKSYFITKLIKNKYSDYKIFNKKYDFSHYEESVLNLITSKIEAPRYFNELPKTFLEKRKIDNNNVEESKKLKIITDVNKDIFEKKETINISLKNGNIIRNEIIKEIYNLENDENEIYFNSILIGKINNEGNLQLSDKIVKKYIKLEFNIDDE